MPMNRHLRFIFCNFFAQNTYIDVRKIIANCTPLMIKTSFSWVGEIKWIWFTAIAAPKIKLNITTNIKMLDMQRAHTMFLTFSAKDLFFENFWGISVFDKVTTTITKEVTMETYWMYVGFFLPKKSAAMTNPWNVHCSSDST